MRKEIFEIGSYVHVVKRGTRGLPVVRDDVDRFRFLLMLTHFNDEFSPLNWFRDLLDENLHNTLIRPAHWPAQKKLVNIVAFALVENHFHLLLQEIVENGIMRFMHKLGTGMAKRYNERYGEHGSLFQGPYRARLVDDDNYFRYVSAYIQVKNVFDVHPNGYVWAQDNFEEAYVWAQTYPYASLIDYFGVFNRPIIDKTFLLSLFDQSEYREFSQDMILGRYKFDEELEAHQSKFFE